MTTTVDKSIDVDVPVSTAYNQWTQFEDFPKFMSGVEQVRQLDDRTLHWVAEIAGVKREWDAKILEQLPDKMVSWSAVDGATNSGAVYFEPLDSNRTRVTLHLDYEPEGFVEQAGDKLKLVAKQTESDLENFKEFIEDRGTETGAWRGSIPEGHRETGEGLPSSEYGASPTQSDPLLGPDYGEDPDVPRRGI